jgi:transcriptional regulator with XRE-family HTH domain
VSKPGYREAVCANVALILRQERERKGLSMTRVAEMAGLSQGMISLVEHEERNPSLDTLLRICCAIEIDLSAVIIRAETEVKKRLV